MPRATLEIVDVTEWWDAAGGMDAGEALDDWEPEQVLSVIVSGPDADTCWSICLEVQTGQRDELSWYLTHANPAEGSWIYEGRTGFYDPASRRVYESNCVLTDDSGTVVKG